MKPHKNEYSYSLFSRNTLINGKIKSDFDSIRFEGKMKGEIISCKKIVTAASAEIIGNLKGKSIVHNGLLEGTIKSEELYLKENSITNGEVVSKVISIENAIFNGDLIISTKK
ncbi:protein of unknown function [Tenacibaculum sp. 190130A14a]|uniref:Polymer-forming cytoskeletal protein n=1 Tax=Tenacibaculum polynesiense TaxID=3137857 RepID=A0ABM9PBN7_9FLAO